MASRHVRAGVSMLPEKTFAAFQAAIPTPISPLTSFGSAKELTHIYSNASHFALPAIKTSAEPQTTSASTVARPAKETSNAVLIISLEKYNFNPIHLV